MTPKPKVSVVIPTHKGRDVYIHEILKSLARQTFRDFEVLIRDNHGTRKGEPAFVASFRSSFPVSYHINPKDIGPRANFETLLRDASGEYVKPMMSDDVIDPLFLERSVAVMAQHPEVSFVFTRRYFIDEEGRQNGAPRYFALEQMADGVVTPGFLLSDCIANQDWYPGEPSNVLIRREHLSRTDLFRSYMGKPEFSYRGSFDLILYLKLLEKGPAYFINECLCGIRQHQGRAQSINHIHVIVVLDYFYFCLDAHHRGLLSKEDAFRYLAHFLSSMYAILRDQVGKLKKPLFALRYIYEITHCLRRSFLFEHAPRETLMFGEALLTILRVHLFDTRIRRREADRLTYAYGAGAMARRYLEQHPELADDIRGFIVSNKEEAGGTLFGKPIIALEDLRSHPFIIVLSMYYEEIREALDRRNFEIVTDYVRVFGPVPFA